MSGAVRNFAILTQMNRQRLSFIYAYPLDNERRNLFKGKELKYPSMEEVKSILEHWERLWAEIDNEKNIIVTIANLIERVPERNLECFVFGAGIGTMSTPFLLPVWNKKGEQWSDDKFVEIIIHELLHIFLSTNSKQYWDKMHGQFGTEEILCRNHILLYAMLYEIYQKLFNREPSDFSRENLPAGYARAIHIVKERGYRELITEYKKIISK